VVLAWGDGDKLFPLGPARRLEADVPDARLQVFRGVSTYVMLDPPDELASAIEAFVRG
jgi:pimeloyl-ACP methyl ester carboxylesterase